MTDFRAMSDDQLDGWLATKVMGWHTGRVNPHPSNQLNWYDKDNNYVMPCIRWQPTTDLNQAVMCAEFLRDKYKFTFEAQTWSEPKVYLVSMYSKDGKALIDTEHKNLARALCEALAMMAVEGEK